MKIFSIEIKNLLNKNSGFNKKQNEDENELNFALNENRILSNKIIELENQLNIVKKSKNMEINNLRQKLKKNKGRNTFLDVNLKKNNEIIIKEKKKTWFKK